MGKPQKVQSMDTVPVSTHAHLSDYLLSCLQNWTGILTKVSFSLRDNSTLLVMTAKQALFSWGNSALPEWKCRHATKPKRTYTH